MELRGKTLLGKYFIERVLGQGGMGKVWQAVHTGTGRKVAIKLLDERYAENASIVERFGREARSASAIQHPGIVEVLDLDRTEKGTPFLVMEFLEGDTLTQRIAKEGKLSQQKAIEIFVPLLDAIGAAHERGIVHRDIKPDNVVLTPKTGGGFRVTVLDFGISQKSDEVRANITQTGAVLGTPHYMPPEQAQGETNLDLRADIYALGVVLYEMVVGDVPFDAGNYNALLQIIINETARTPRERGALIHPAFESVILACMNKDREQRPQSIAEVKAMLMKAAKGESPLSPRQNSKMADATVPTQTSESGWGDFETLGRAEPPAPRAPAAPHVATSSSAPVSLSGLDELPSLDLDLAPHAAPAALSVGGGVRELSDEFEDPLASGGTLELAADLSSGPAHVRGARTARTSPVPHKAPTASQSAPEASPRVTTRNTPEPSTVSTPVSNEEATASEPKFDLVARLRELPVAFWRVVIGLVFFLVIVIVIRILVRPSEVAQNLSDPNAAMLPPVAANEAPAVAEDPNANVIITGLPPEAAIRLDGFPISAMPLRVRKGALHTVEISAPGYEPRHIVFTPTSDLSLAANMRHVN